MATSMTSFHRRYANGFHDLFPKFEDIDSNFVTMFFAYDRGIAKGMGFMWCIVVDHTFIKRSMDFISQGLLSFLIAENDSIRSI